MKLATYFRNRGDSVRFFKGDLRDFAAALLFEEFWEENYAVDLGEYTGLMRQYIRAGKSALLNDIPDFQEKQKLLVMRARYKNNDFPKFDIVGVTTLFTFYWRKTIETINAAKKFVVADGRIIVGGIASSILAKQLIAETAILPHIGLLDMPGVIDKGDETIIDELPLDYSILDEIDYTYPARNAYFAYTTRGCVNRCSFCAVPRLEPKYRQYISIREQIAATREQFGEQKDLLLLDNNVFASRRFDKIIDEIKECGFGKGATYIPSNEYTIAVDNIRAGYNVRFFVRKVVAFYDRVAPKLPESGQGEFYNARENRGLLYADTATAKSVMAFDKTFAPLYQELVYAKQEGMTHGNARYIDFNQGVDARLVTEAKMKKLAEVNIRPLRIAFDHWGVDPQKPDGRPMREIYADAVRLAAKYGIRNLSNYLLYNSDDDTPDELYLRLRLNVNLCEELDVHIYSFPMKYHPIDDPSYFDNRRFIGKAWNRKYIRAVQAVLNATHGKIGRGRSFFEAAFGKDLGRFHEILMMPEAFIIERYKYDREAYTMYAQNGGSRKLKPAVINRYGTMTAAWRTQFSALNPKQRRQAEKIIFKNIFTDETCAVSDSAVG
ncbi:MAG: radical SAM protein, partial [Oscillospiraceae bacterium]|nr:radical SAM protein [Oscillospiraceae bacterium]